MKKILKAIVCILIVALTIFGFIAKYDTLGIYPFQAIRHYTFEEAIKEAGSKVQGQSCDNVYKNRFGRVVYMCTARSEGLSCNYHSHDNIKAEDCSICNPPPNRVVSLYTVSPGIATHLDFLNLSNSPKPFISLLKEAGMPTWDSQSLYFVFETLDGYQYYVRGGAPCSLAGLKAVVAPNGTKLTSAQITALTVKIYLVYLGAAAVLSVLLYFLLKLNRRLHPNASASHPPVCKRKIAAVFACFLLLLGYGIRAAANSDYYGIISSLNFEIYLTYAWNTTPDYPQAIQNGLLENHFGKTAVFTSRSSGKDTTYIPLGTYTPKPRIHLSMLSIAEGASTTQLFSNLGVPDIFEGSAGNKTLIYKLPMGYSYAFSTAYNSGISLPAVTGWTITAPDGTQLDAAAFQWQVRLTYLGIAAGLGILAAALAIPNHIRKRKASV